MLIGDKGESGGRRWGGGLFGGFRYSDQPQGPSLGVHFSLIGIFGQSQGHPLEPHKELSMFNQRILSLDHPY